MSNYTYVFDGADLVAVKKNDPIPVYPRREYKYQGVSMNEYLNWSYEEKEKFVKEIHYDFMNLTINQFIRAFGFEKASEKNEFTAIATKVGMTNTRGRLSEKERDSLRSLEHSNVIVNHKAIKAVTDAILEADAKEKETKTVEPESVIVNESKPKIHYLQLSGEIEDTLLRIIDLGLTGKYKITIEAEK